MSSYWDILNNLDSKPTANPLLELKEGAEDLQHPTGAEPALIHPFNNAMVKLRDNGVIDIFADTNVGIRVDPNLQNISVVTDGWRSHLGYLIEWIMDNEERYIGGNSKTKIGGNIYLEVGGNAQVIVKGNAKIDVGGNIDIKNGGVVNWTSDGNMYFNAPNYYWR